MRVGLVGGIVGDETLDETVAEIRQAEADGFSTYWAGHSFRHELLTLLAIAGREVPRIEFGTAVLPIYLRHPAVMGQQALTVSAACQGRLTVGVGIGHRIVIESMFGVKHEKHAEYLRDYLGVLVPVSRNEPVSYDGALHSSHIAISPKGAPTFKIITDAHSTDTLRVTGAMADGVLTWSAGRKSLADFIVPTVTEAADEAGRRPPRVITALPVCVTDNPQAARERGDHVFERYNMLASYQKMLERDGASSITDIAIFGSADEVVNRVLALAEIGVTDFAAVEFPGNPDEAAATREALKRSFPTRPRR